MAPVEKVGSTVEDARTVDEPVPLEEEGEDGGRRSMSGLRIALVLLSLYGISAASSMGTGLVMIGIPRIARDLSLQGGLLLW